MIGEGRSIYSEELAHAVITNFLIICSRGVALFLSSSSSSRYFRYFNKNQEVGFIYDENLERFDTGAVIIKIIKDYDKENEAGFLVDHIYPVS